MPPCSPLFLERPGFDFETPGGAVLFDEVGGNRSDADGIDGKVVRAVLKPRARHPAAHPAADDDERPLTRASHGGNRLLAAKKEAKRVHAPGALRIPRLDLLDMAPDTRAG